MRLEAAKNSLQGLVERLYLLLNQFNFMRFNQGLFAGILLFAAATGNAQFKRGDRMVGTAIGSVFFNSGSADVSFSQFPGYSSKTNSYGLRIEPAFGLFISEKTAVGASLNIN